MCNTPSFDDETAIVRTQGGVLSKDGVSGVSGVGGVSGVNIDAGDSIHVESE